MDSSVFFIFAVVVVGTLLSFLFKFFFFALLFPLSGSCGEVVANLSACSPCCRCYFIFSTNQLIVFCVKQALRGGVLTINLHVSFQKKCEFYKQD